MQICRYNARATTYFWTWLLALDAVSCCKLLCLGSNIIADLCNIAATTAIYLAPVV